MADMGTDALQNISQILKFLKIQKLHRILSDDDELDELERNLLQQIKEDNVEQKALAEQQATQKQGAALSKTTVSQKDGDSIPMSAGPLAIQRFLNKLGIGETTPSSQNIKPQNLGANQSHNSTQPVGTPEGSIQVVENKNEEYYLNNCPIEMASICIKSLVDILVQVGVCHSVEDVPAQVNKLLQQCNRKSDHTVEQEILERYLSTTRRIIEKQIGELRIHPGQASTHMSISESQRQLIKDQLISPSSVQLPREGEARRVTTHDDASRSRSRSGSRVHTGQVTSPLGEDSAGSEAHRTGPFSAEAEKLRLDLEKLRVKLEEQKLKSRHLQLNLAGKIVVLEEQIEQAAHDREERIQQLEKAHQEELQRITGGVEQREEQLLQLCDDYREEARDLQVKLETSWKPAEESKTIQKMEKGTRGNLYKLMKDEYERLFRKNSDLLANYQASINEFVYLREDLRGSFTLAFDYERLDDGLLNMLNEAMLKYYLSKAFGLDKSKFRFLRSEELFEKRKGGRASDESQILKLVIEVVAEDQGKVSQLFRHVKAQIKDGTSLLFDFMPLYFGMNLGSSGFSTHHNLKDFALLCKVGQAIDGEDFVISVLRNKEKPLIFKILAFNLELREEFMMELSESDIYELVEGDQQVLRNLEPDALVKKITSNLNLIVRDKIKVLTCEQKIFFNEIWMQNMESGKHQQVHTRSPLETQLLAADASVQHRTTQAAQSPLTHTAARTSQLSRLQPKVAAPPQAFVERFKGSVACQTDFEISTLYEGFENVYRGVQKVGEVTHMRLSIQESSKTKTLVFIFDDLTSLKKLKFSLYVKAGADQYVVHSECMRITDGHHVLVSVEQVQQQGLLIKMYDLLECKSVSFSLLRKQNGQFSKLGEESTLDLLMKQDFRNFLYELTFVVDKEANEALMHNMQYLFREDTREASARVRSPARQMEDLEQKKQIESLKRESAYKKQTAGKVLPRRKRAMLATRLYSFSQRAFYKDKWTDLAASSALHEEGLQVTGGELESKGTATPPAQSRYPGAGESASDSLLLTDWRESPGEKGSLLYRNVFMIRCIFNGGEETAQEGVITLYLKDTSVHIEVSLHKELSQMSIASSVHALDLFGDDPTVIPFKERIGLLNNMMEKFFVISDGSVYHMKVESDAVPVQEFLEEKKREVLLKNPKENKAQEYDVILTAQKIREIQDEKEQYSNTDKATRYCRFADIDGEMHEVEMLFIKKAEGKAGKGGGRHGKKFSTYGKSQTEIVQIQIEQFVEEQCDWDSIYFEISDQSRETVPALYDKKRLAQMLAKDEYFDWKSALSQVDPLLLDYIKRSVKVDKLKGDVWLHNKENVEQDILQKFRRAVGGKYLMRLDLDLAPDEQKIVSKQLIANSEIEMSEFLYDLKIYQIQKVSDKDIIAYQLEIFTLSDPDVVYQFTYPMNFSAETQDPHTLVIDVVNLIEHPFKAAALKQKGKQSAKGGQGTGSGTAALVGVSHPGASGKDTVGQTGLIAAGNEAEGALQSKAAHDKTAFQQLFRKYIDNRVLLFVQESRFPRRLDFILTEPCSQLQWRHHIEPRQITTGMASLHLVDQATLEMFLAVLLDENQNCGPSDEKVFEHENKEADLPACHKVDVFESWQDINEISEAAQFVTNLTIPGTDFALSLCKRRNALSVELRRSSQVKVDDQENDENASDRLEFRIDPLAGDTTLAKVIREQGLNYSVLYVKTQGACTILKVVSLTPVSIHTLFKFTFLDDQEGHLDDSDFDQSNTFESADSPIFTATDLQASTVDALRRYYGSQTMDQAMRIFESIKTQIDRDNDSEYQAPNIFERMEEEAPSVYKTRMISNYLSSLDTRTIILQRKRFFDDQCDKLIMMHVQVTIKQLDGKDNITEDIDMFHVILQVPESDHEVMYETAIGSFLTQEEFAAEQQQNSFRNKTHLKRLAKKFLEHRVEIKRVQDEYDDEEMQGDPKYTFEIVFEPTQNHIGDIQSMMGSEQQDKNQFAVEEMGNEEMAENNALSMQMLSQPLTSGGYQQSIIEEDEDEDKM